MASEILHRDNNGGNCEVCEASGLVIPAKFYCVNCVMLICDACKDKHGEHSGMKSHVVHVYSAQPLLQETSMCKQHVQKPATYWCSKCNVPVCSVCVISCHENHSMTDIISYTQDVITPLKNAKENVKLTLDTLDKNVECIADKIKQLQSDLEKTKTRIEKHAKDIVKRVVVEKHNLISDLEDLYEMKINDLKCCLNNQQNNMNVMEEWKSDLNTILSQTADTSALAEVKYHIKKGDTLAGQKAVSTSDPQLYMFDANNRFMTIGELVADQPGVKLLCSDTVSGAPVNDVKFVGSDKFCVVQMEAVSVYEHNGKTMRLIHSTHLDKHYLVRAVARDAHTVYLTCYICKSVHLYDVISRQLSVNVDQWRSDMFGNPYGVAVTTSGNVVVGDFESSPKQVFVHKPNGARLYALGGATGANGCYPNIMFGDPENVACDGETIIISDRIGHCVFICEHNNSRPTIIGQPDHSGSGDNELDSPQGVCVTNQGSIIVADRGNSRVSEYTARGVLLRHLLSADTPNVGRPYQVDFIKSQRKRLLLVLHGGDDIRLFEI